MDVPLLSIIIPTHNRKETLARGLDSLGNQTYPVSDFEVIVVDDGSEEEICGDLHSRRYPFVLRCVRQPNSGATVARNHGAEISHGELLVFMDDDIVLLPETLQTVIEDLAAHQRSVVLATLRLPLEISHRSLFGRFVAQGMAVHHSQGEIPFQECMTGLLAVRRLDFFDLGMFHDPTGGWPNWDDVDFGYRATQAGFKCRRNPLAVAEHWDYAASDLSAACQRSYRAGLSASKLLKRYPVLKDYLPMFWDKGPIDWRQDPPLLILRKWVRRVLSARFSLLLMERIAYLLERSWAPSTLLFPLYRWIIGGYIFRGYQDGLKELV